MIVPISVPFVIVFRSRRPIGSSTLSIAVRPFTSSRSLLLLVKPVG